MAYKPKILAFAGSTRVASYNKKLVKIASRGSESAGAEVIIIDLKEYPLPLYDGDHEEEFGLPEKAKELKELFLASDGFLISAPEYNSSMSAVLKNLIDWVSRPAAPDEQPLICFRGKFASIMSASPSNLGGMRGLVHLRAMLENIMVTVLPYQKVIPLADGAFTSDGSLANERDHEAVEQQGHDFAEFLQKFYKG